MARTPSRQPTDAELDLLRVLWESGPAGLGAIHAALANDRPVALTTVATTLKTMREKRLVERSDGPRGYLWSAVLSRRAAASGFVGKLVQRVFDGSAHRLIAHLIEQEPLSDAERAELLALLEASKTKGGVKGTKSGGKEAKP